MTLLGGPPRGASRSQLYSGWGPRRLGEGSELPLSSLGGLENYENTAKHRGFTDWFQHILTQRSKTSPTWVGWIGRLGLTYTHCAKLLQSCPTLCDSMDCSPSGFSVGGILQARILEWVAISSSGDLQGSNPDLLHCRQFLYHLSHQGSLSENANTILTLFS